MGGQKQAVEGFTYFMVQQGLLAEGDEALVLGLEFLVGHFIDRLPRLPRRRTARGRFTCVIGYTTNIVIHALHQNTEGFFTVVAESLCHKLDVFFFRFVNLAVDHHHRGQVFQIVGLFLVGFWNFYDDFPLFSSFIRRFQTEVKLFFGKAKLVGNGKNQLLFPVGDVAIKAGDREQVDDIRHLCFLVRIELCHGIMILLLLY